MCFYSQRWGKCFFQFVEKHISTKMCKILCMFSECFNNWRFNKLIKNEIFTWFCALIKMYLFRNVCPKYHHRCFQVWHTSPITFLIVNCVLIVWLKIYIYIYMCYKNIACKDVMITAKRLLTHIYIYNIYISQQLNNTR